jgi:hypothetical protein
MLRLSTIVRTVSVTLQKHRNAYILENGVTTMHRWPLICLVEPSVLLHTQSQQQILSPARPRADLNP